MAARENATVVTDGDRGHDDEKASASSARAAENANDVEKPEEGGADGAKTPNEEPKRTVTGLKASTSHDSVRAR